MGLISRLLGKPVDHLKKGDLFFDSQRFYEARSVYEEGVRSLQSKAGSGEIMSQLREKIALANREMARLNIVEAEHALNRDLPEKAVEHLELALSLTGDRGIHEECGRMLLRCEIAAIPDIPRKPVPVSGATCQSCHGSAGHEHSSNVPELSPADHFELLIRQLPSGLCSRYALLDDDFVELYLLASRDEHEEALKLLETWYKGDDEDIYWHEKGTLLHRLGNIAQAETSFRRSQGCNSTNPLPCLSLAVLLCQEHRYDEAANQLDAMISAGMIVEQALLLRGEVCEISGDLEGAMERYSALLRTPAVRPAADRLYDLLNRTGRGNEAVALKKTYLSGCGH